MIKMTSKEKQEQQCKEKLELCFPELAPLVNADKPDLQNREQSIGIEVTLAMDKRLIEAMNNTSKKKEVAKEVRYSYGSVADVVQAFQKKVQKAKGYSSFDDLRLYIETIIYDLDECYQKDAEEKIQNLMNEFCKNNNNTFTTVYLDISHSHNVSLIVFDLVKGIYYRIEK